MTIQHVLLMSMYPLLDDSFVREQVDSAINKQINEWQLNNGSIKQAKSTQRKQLMQKLENCKPMLQLCIQTQHIQELLFMTGSYDGSIIEN